MTKKEAERLLSAYSAGGLAPEEEKELHRHAFDDQEFFNELMEAEELRNALSSPAQRQRLLAGLRPTQSGSSIWNRFQSWMSFPAGLALAGAAAAIVVALVVWRPGHEAVTPGGDNAPAAVSPEAGVGWFDQAAMREIFNLPPQSALVVNFSLAHDSSSAFRPGESLGMDLAVELDADIFIFEQTPGGALRQIYPVSEKDSPRLEGGQRIRVPAVASVMPGKYRVRILAVPFEQEPKLKQRPVAWSLLDGLITVDDREYVVGRP